VQKPVPFHAQINKGRLERRLYIDDTAFVDIPRLLAVAFPFEKDLGKLAVLQDGHPHFAGLSRVQ